MKPRSTEWPVRARPPWRSLSLITAGILQHFHDGILWAGLGPQANAMSVLGAWAEALGHDVAQLPDVEQRRVTVKRMIGQRHVLLILDDAWTIEDAETLRCGGPNCRHLLTTRDKGVARVFAGVSNTYVLPPIDHDAALPVLRSLAPEAYASDPAAVATLARAVGGLPLALQILGGYLGTPERSIFAELTHAALRELGGSSPRLDALQNGLAKTIALSLDRLPPAAAAAFHSLGTFAPEPAQFTLDAAKCVAATNAETLALLARANLFSVNGDALSMHIALAEVAHAGLSHDAVARHREYYVAWVNESPTNWPRIDVALDGRGTMRRTMNGSSTS